MHTVPKNKKELAMIIAIERAAAEMKAIEIAHNIVEEIRSRLRLEIASYSNLSEEQTEDLIKIVNNTYYK